ncbi:AmpG family muropeptide MFS transporter [Iodidimonas sp. SYSU 1G8]|uniref:AmpG family muropeptide MFS transporter n=1 Tax=Iodidimonas sp. SYSU 1G8 TaxID=3133967 RepID=UPI0031FEEAF1
MTESATYVLPRPWIERLTRSAVFFEKRVFLFFFLGFASGLPFVLPFGTLTYWLTEVGTDKGEVGLFTLVTLPFAFKFVWAPIIDRLPFPVLNGLLGRRRGWLFGIQIALIGAILLMASSDPGPGHLTLTAMAAVLVAFLSASQDIVIDGLRVELLDERQQGAGVAAYTIGYRIALLITSAGILLVAGHGGWPIAYAAVALLMLVGVAATLLTPEPPLPSADDAQAQETDARAFLGRWPGIPSPLHGAAAWFYVAVAAPFIEFFRRFGVFALIVLALVLFYKLGDTLAAMMTGPFYLELGFTLDQVGLISKPVGLVATIAGALLGGVMVNRLGVMKSLWIGGLVQLFSNFTYVLLAWAGPDPWVLGATIGIENFASGVGVTAFIAYMSGLCNISYTVTQYALLSSLMNVGRTLLSAPAGYVAEAVNWPMYFSLTVLAAVPGLVLLYFVTRHFGSVTKQTPPVN